MTEEVMREQMRAAIADQVEATIAHFRATNRADILIATVEDFARAGWYSEAFILISAGKARAAGKADDLATLAFIAASHGYDLEGTLKDVGGAFKNKAEYETPARMPAVYNTAYMKKDM